MLLRQLRRAIDASTPQEVETLLNSLFSLVENKALDSRQAGTLNGLRSLLSMVGESYQQFERAQELRLRSLTVSSAELMEANRRLRDDADHQRALIDTMRTAANRMLAAAGRDLIPAGETSAQHVAQMMTQLIGESETAKARLQESETRYRSLTSLSADWYWEQDEQQRFTLMSQGISAVTGQQAEDFIGQTRLQAFAANARYSNRDAYQQLSLMMQTRQAFRNFELCFAPPGRDGVFVSLSGEPRFDGAGKFQGYRGVARNITPQKRAEVDLQEALQLTDTLLDVTPIPIAIKDGDLRHIRVNEAFVRMFGVSREVWMGKTSREVRGDAAARGEAEEQALLTQPRVLQYENTRSRPNSEDLHYVVTKAPLQAADGSVTRIISTFSDITELKRVQRQLTQQLTLTDALIESMPMPVSIKDRGHHYTRLNAAYELEFGVQRAQVLGQTVAQALHDNAHGGQSVEAEMLLNPGVRSYTRKRVTAGGHEKYFVITKAPIMDAQGEVSGFITMHADVTDLKQTEQRLDEQLQFTNVILETSPEPMAVKNSARQITYVNAAYEQLFEVDRHTILSREMRPHAPEVMNEIERIEAELLANPGSRQFEYALPASSGRMIHCIITQSTFRDRAGGIGGLITTYTDISGLKAAEASKAAQLRLTTTLLDASPTPTVIKDKDLTLIRCNTAYERLFDVRREDILNRPMQGHRIQYADDVRAVELALLKKPATHRIERSLRAYGDRDIHCIIEKSTYRDVNGDVEGIITTFTDVSEHKRTEESLREAKSTAEQAMRARSQFLANMSHEIRTPMNGVLGMANVLADTPLNAEQRDYLNTIRSSGESLLKIVSDILDFSKIEAGKVDIEAIAFDIRSRVASNLQLFNASAREKNLALTATYADDLPTQVVGDPVRISQALSNLMGNAIKFTHSGSVDVHVSVQARAGAHMMLQFDVNDSGIGISDDAIERIFDPFSQEDASTTRRFGGTGLGLTISRQLVGLMGGELSVTSTQGAGSCFRFTVKVLHVASSNAAHVATPTAAPARTAPTEANQRVLATLKILLAEDNTINQIVAGAMLKKLGCSVTVAKDGREALVAVSAHHFDLILMDCHMPNMDGFAATAAIRALEKDGHPRHTIIAQTANAMEGDRETCLAAGMDDYLAKPLNTATLADMLQRWSARRDA